MQCSCSEWVVPAIGVARGRVDVVEKIAGGTGPGRGGMAGKGGAPAPFGIRLPPGMRSYPPSGNGIPNGGGNGKGNL